MLAVCTALEDGEYDGSSPRTSLTYYSLAAAAITLRVYQLWGSGKTPMFVIWAGFVVTYTGVVVGNILFIRDLSGNMEFVLHYGRSLNEINRRGVDRRFAALHT